MVYFTLPKEFVKLPDGNIPADELGKHIHNITHLIGLMKFYVDYYEIETSLELENAKTINFTNPEVEKILNIEKKGSTKTIQLYTLGEKYGNINWRYSPCSLRTIPKKFEPRVYKSLDKGGLISCRIPGFPCGMDSLYRE